MVAGEAADRCRLDLLAREDRQELIQPVGSDGEDHPLLGF